MFVFGNKMGELEMCTTNDNVPYSTNGRKYKLIIFASTREDMYMQHAC